MRVWVVLEPIPGGYLGMTVIYFFRTISLSASGFCEEQINKCSMYCEAGSKRQSLALTENLQDHSLSSLIFPPPALPPLFPPSLPPPTPGSDSRLISLLHYPYPLLYPQGKTAALERRYS